MSDEKNPLSPEMMALLDFLAKRFAPDYDQQQALARQKMQEIYLPVPPPEKVPVPVPCVHPSGFRFDAMVVPSASPAFPHGRWVQIMNERWPSDEELCEWDPSWGRDPNRFKRDEDGNADPSKGYTQAKQLELYDRVRLPILRLIGGDPNDPTVGHLPIEWREDMQERVKALKAAAAAEQKKFQAELAALPVPPQAPIAKTAPKAARAIPDAK